MLRLALVGKDVSKSLSPQMHASILKGLGEELIFEKFSVPDVQLARAADALFQNDAFYVTIPFKEDVLAYLDKVEGDAAVFGAANLVRAKDRTGFNTDGYGFMLMLENAGISVRGKKVLVLGSGGAGKSCIYALLKAGARVYAYNRTPERLMAVHRLLSGFTPLTSLPAAPYDVIVNATGVGMHDSVGISPVNGELISLCECAVDLIYEPAETEFLRLARERGKKTVNGAAMLYYQAYYGDCILLGRTPSAREAKELYEQYTEEKR